MSSPPSGSGSRWVGVGSSSSSGVYTETPRSSLDHHRSNGNFVDITGSSNGHGQAQGYRQGPAMSGSGYNGDRDRGGEGGPSRRPSSSSSTHQSPASASASASTSSSSRHHVVRGEVDTHGWPTPSVGGVGVGGYPSPRQLPRITTSSPGPSGDSDGPRSAPPRPPNGLLPRESQPLRSSSSPDPRTPSYPGSERSSPTEPRPQFAGGPAPVLGSPFPVPRPHRPTASPTNTPLPIPPRKSSQTDMDRVLHSQNSHTSLSDGGHTDATQSTSTLIPREQRTGRSRGDPTYCGQCGQVVHGQFVRAMGKVFHLNCFRCKDCNKVVAQKFFPVEEPDGMFPLCERDYFARLDLICAKCDQALRSSYITACGGKYHVEHFTCSECDVVFGPNDSYYEHAGKVYCHYHYSTKFAVKCVGCETAILKQFVEMNRNGRDECWHPECYMISKFWNVRLASKNFNTPANSAVSSSISLLEITPSATAAAVAVAGLTMTSSPGSMSSSLPKESPGGSTELSPEELKDRQEMMELKVLQIWHVLSGYEESSAALIGEMLRAVNGRNLLEIILLAEKFILHVETLFAVIDDLEAQFAFAGLKGISHAREAKQLCRKLVNLFSIMSQVSPLGDAAPNTQELFNLITQLAHYLKILIRIALTGSIKLERDQARLKAMANALARLNLLAMDGSDPAVKKRGDVPETPPPQLVVREKDGTVTPGGGGDEEQLKRAMDSLTRRPEGFIASTQGIAYGYRSLAYEATNETTLRGPHDEDFIPPEVCAHCHTAIEDECVRLGMFNRWHSSCLQCGVCGDRAVPPAPTPKDEPSDETSRGSADDGTALAVITSRPRRPPPRLHEFFFQPVGDYMPPHEIYCSKHRTPQSVNGFESVTRLEQYAFLLHIALRRLYVHFRQHHNLPSVRDMELEDAGTSTPGRDHDVKRMKSVTLDRKLSSTARLPQRSTIVEAPAGRMADANGQVTSARSQQAITPLQVEDDIRNDVPDEQPSSATLDVIRPPFARNNTSVLIINENNPEVPPSEPVEFFVPPAIVDEDMMTLSDIPLLAEAAIGARGAPGGKPLLSSLNALQLLIIKHFALLQLMKTGIGHLIELDDILELLDVRKGQWWNKIFKGNAKKDVKKKGVFGVPLEILVDRTGSDSSQGVSGDQLRVPEFVEDIISTMRQMDMAVEGIFRKNGNIRRLQLVAESLDRDPAGVNLWEENPVQLAALLKRWLREMPDPLLTFRLHKLFCAAASLPNVEDRRRVLHLLVTLLPRANRDLMEVLFVFLRWVGTFSYRDEETGSRMDLPNLATVVCPSILYAKGGNVARDESFIAIAAVQDLLENQDEYYTVPSELMFVLNENIFTLFAKELDLPPKEIHRHCSKYVQARSQNQANQASRIGTGTGTGPSASSSQTQMHLQLRDRDRPNDNSGASSSATTPNPSSYRPTISPSGGVNPPGGSGGNGGNGPVPTAPNAPNLSRPPSWINSHSHQGSQQSLHHNLTGSPGSAQWRGGPFQGAGNGSRTSSRGSAPASPGPDEARRSFQLDRERTRTPVQHEHR